MKPKIEFVSVDSVLPRARNSRKHTDKQIKQIAASIKEFGFLAPIIITANNTIVAGHGRVEAAKLAGLKEIPAVSLSIAKHARRHNSAGV